VQGAGQRLFRWVVADVLRRIIDGKSGVAATTMEETGVAEIPAMDAVITAIRVVERKISIANINTAKEMAR